MKYLLRKNEEKSVCVICKKSFAKIKGSNIKTCSKKCKGRLVSRTRRNKRENRHEI